MKSTVRIPQDKRHRHIVTIPIEIWEGEKLSEGDLIEIDVRKIEKPIKARWLQEFREDKEKEKANP